VKLMSWLAGFFVVVLTLTGNGYAPALATESPDWQDGDDGWSETYPDEVDDSGLDFVDDNLSVSPEEFADDHDDDFFGQIESEALEVFAPLAESAESDGSTDQGATADGEKLPLEEAIEPIEKRPAEEMATKIVGGTQTSPIFEVALIRTNASNNFQGQFCGGTIIDVQWILTAAHCVDSGVTSRPAGLVVQAGNGTLSQVGPVQGLAVSRIIVHPGWNPTTWDNDIALVQLANPLVLGPETQVASLPTGVTPAGTQARVSGWGAVLFGADLYPLTIRAALVEVVADSDCRGLFTVFTDNTMVCAGVPPTFTLADSCQGDSGGPLAINPGTGWQVIGVTSFGRGCASGTPGVYAEVRAFTAWISEAITSTGMFSKAPRPTISGFAARGERLVGTVPQWSPKPDVVSYQWLRNGEPISGATKRSYRLKKADLGKRISVQVTANRGNFIEQTKSSVRTPRIGTRFSEPSARIAGTREFGSTLRAEPGNWGTKNVTFSYQWLRDGKPISKATQSTYKLRSSDVGKRIRVEITGSKKGFATESVTSSRTKKIDAKAFKRVSKPTPTGDVRIGKTLRVRPGDWGTKNVTYSYQWLRDGQRIRGATKSTYRLTRADAGADISVRVRGAKKGFKTRAVTSVVRNDWRTVTRTTTVAADQIFPVNSCRSVGTTENSCRVGGSRTGRGGVRLVSPGGDDLMAIAGSVRLKGAPQRWQMTLNTVTKKRGSDFTISSTTSKPQRQSRWREIGSVGTKRVSKGSYRTNWTKRVDGNRVRFVVSSTDRGSLYIQSVTIRYDTIL